jgi:hypothetical protein
MPRRSYPWRLVDKAAKSRAAKLIDERGLSLRDFADETDGVVKYSRVRDIRLGKSAPMRLSEFLVICDVCGADPILILQQILEDARHGNREAEDSLAENGQIDDSDEFDLSKAKYRAMHIDELGLAAKHGDIDAEQQAYEEMP